MYKINKTMQILSISHFLSLYINCNYKNIEYFL